VTTVADRTLTRFTTISASQLFSMTDADGDEPTQYVFANETLSGTPGYFTVGGVRQANDSNFTVAAANLSTVYFVTSESWGYSQVYIRADDNYSTGQWGHGVIFSPGNAAPVVTVTPPTVAAGAAVDASSFFSVTDPEGDAIARYQFAQTALSGSAGYFTVNGISQAAGIIFSISAEDLSTVKYVASNNWGYNQLYFGVEDSYGAVGTNFATVFNGGATLPSGIASDTTIALIGDTAANLLIGGAGNDILDGGAGIDTLIGGSGDDTYIVDNAADVVTEGVGEGVDLVQSSVTYTLSANLEGLKLTGTVAINGTGNTLDNLLTGNAATNQLNGGVGADTMIGGAGDDIYDADNVGDVVTETAAEGVDTVQASISYALGADVENLTLTGTAAINATGNASANIIKGNAASNTLAGGVGNDTLIGGGGSDTYGFGRGDGQDVIVNGTNLSPTPTSKLSLSAGVARNQLWLNRSMNDLQISIMGGLDLVTISGWYGNEGAQLTQVATSDGWKLDTQLSSLVQAMANYSSVNPGFNPITATQAPTDTTLQNALAAAWHQ
jgi:Ca2+-binding RTX toxin-like protein